jgi:tRNA uridine 5-carboxymethylaminomethyl modification enzyme
LRADNAETRLSGIAEAAGCLGDARRRRRSMRRDALASIAATLEKRVSAADVAARGGVGVDGPSRSGADWLRLAGITVLHVAPDLAHDHDAALIAEAVEDARYAPYIARQADDVARLRGNDAVALPADLDFAAVPGLSHEMVERLIAAAPATLGAAGRIRGITPAALTAILLYARRRAA